MTASHAAVLASLQASRKYRHVAPDALERVAREACRVARSPDDAVKRAKRRLHQIFAAFVTDGELAKAQKRIDALPDRADDAALRTAARALLGLHASTRERLPELARFYDELFAVTGTPRRLLDLGCGFHPFALPWMGLAPDVEYFACDLDQRLLGLVKGFLARTGCRGEVLPCDLIAGAPARHADVALLMKLLPTLERQSAGASARLLETLSARYLVVTFPAASLGGRGKGMAASSAGFARFMEELLAPRRVQGWTSVLLPRRDEWVYVIERPVPRFAAPPTANLHCT